MIYSGPRAAPCLPRVPARDHLPAPGYRRPCRGEREPARHGERLGTAIDSNSDLIYLGVDDFISFFLLRHAHEGPMYSFLCMQMQLQNQ